MNRTIVDVQREPQDSGLLGRVLRRTRLLHLAAAVVLLGLSIGLATAAMLFLEDAVRLPMWGKALLIVLTATSCYAGGYCAIQFVRMFPLCRPPQRLPPRC